MGYHLNNSFKAKSLFLIERNWKLRPMRIIIFSFQTIFLLLFISCGSQKEIPMTEAEKAIWMEHYKIKEYLTFSVELDRDTIKLGDTIKMNICFYNNSDTIVNFFPNGLLSMQWPREEIVLEHFDIITHDLDYDLYTLLPQEQYCFEHSAKTSSWTSGSFQRILVYHHTYNRREIPDDIPNLQFGKLKSQILQVCIEK